MALGKHYKTNIHYNVAESLRIKRASANETRALRVPMRKLFQVLLVLQTSPFHLRDKKVKIPSIIDVFLFLYYKDF